MIPSLSIEELARRVDVLASNGGRRDITAQKLGLSTSSLRESLRAAREAGLMVPPPNSPIRTNVNYELMTHDGRLDLEIEDGVMLIGSDAHIWGPEPTVAMLAFLSACRYFRDRDELSCVVLNGDIVDAAAINRHQTIGWEKKPTFADEVAGAQTQLREIRREAGNVEYVWPIGNHDQNFERQIANLIPGLEGMPGVHLKDHFPDWKPCWSLYVNRDELEVTHRVKGGMHAAYNNIKESGISTATGHTHRLLCRPFVNKTGRKYGIETGMLGVPYARQFINYTEANSVDWSPGFAALTFYKSELLWPEFVAVLDANSWTFRGRVYRG